MLLYQRLGYRVCYLKGWLQGLLSQRLVTGSAISKAGLQDLLSKMLDYRVCYLKGWLQGLLSQRLGKGYGNSKGGFKGLGYQMGG